MPRQRLGRGTADPDRSSGSHHSSSSALWGPSALALSAARSNYIYLYLYIYSWIIQFEQSID